MAEGFSGNTEGCSGNIEGYSGNAEGYSRNAEGYSGKAEGYSGNAEGGMVFAHEYWKASKGINEKPAFTKKTGFSERNNLITNLTNLMSCYCHTN